MMLEEDQPMDIVQRTSSTEGKNVIVSAVFKCQTNEAKKLAIYDLSYKLKKMDNYDIGGTSTGSEPELWFYYKTSVCPGYNFLLNLFVCHRKVGNFTIGTSSSNKLFIKKQRHEESQAYLPDTLTWYSFRSSQPNQNHYVKTYHFTDIDVKDLQDCILYVPITIEMNSVHTLNKDVLRSIKLNHDFSDLLAKQETTDFVLEAASHKKFPVHKIILAAHSPVLRKMIKKSKSNAVFIDISDVDVELLLQFIYSGTIKDIAEQDCLKLLDIANRFQLKNLCTLAQFAISDQINVTNAVDVALISEKYKLDELQITVFEYIKNHPDVLQTDGWNKLNDVNLSKKLFQYVYKKTSSITL